MACACKVNRDITYLQKKYGEKQPENKRTNIKGALNLFFKKIFFSFIIVIFFPLMFAHVLCHRGKRINITKLFNLKKI